MALDLLELGARIGRMESRLAALEAREGGNDDDGDEDDEAEAADPQEAEMEAAVRGLSGMVLSGLAKVNKGAAAPKG